MALSGSYPDTRRKIAPEERIDMSSERKDQLVPCIRANTRACEQSMGLRKRKFRRTTTSRYPSEANTTCPLK
jgi:hypothetical protein